MLNPGVVGCTGIVEPGTGVKPGRGAKLGGASAGVIIWRVPGAIVGGGGIVVPAGGMNPRGKAGIAFDG